MKYCRSYVSHEPKTNLRANEVLYAVRDASCTERFGNEKLFAGSQDRRDLEQGPNDGMKSGDSQERSMLAMKKKG